MTDCARGKIFTLLFFKRWLLRGEKNVLKCALGISDGIFLKCSDFFLACVYRSSYAAYLERYAV
jgi:hypothetical protein